MSERYTMVSKKSKSGPQKALNDILNADIFLRSVGPKKIPIYMDNTIKTQGVGDLVRGRCVDPSAWKAVVPSSHARLVYEDSFKNSGDMSRQHSGLVAYSSVFASKQITPLSPIETPVCSPWLRVTDNSAVPKLVSPLGAIDLVGWDSNTRQYVVTDTKTVSKKYTGTTLRDLVVKENYAVAMHLYGKILQQMAWNAGYLDFEIGYYLIIGYDGHAGEVGAWEILPNEKAFLSHEGGEYAKSMSKRRTPMFLPTKADSFGLDRLKI